MMIVHSGESRDMRQQMQDEIEVLKAKLYNAQRNTLNALAQEIHENAKEHGWWESERNFGEIIALCHSELSEALEEERAGNPVVWHGENGKPEGAYVELIDCVIRILDYLGHVDADPEEIIREKMEYNKERPYKHGKRF